MSTNSAVGISIRVAVTPWTGTGFRRGVTAGSTIDPGTETIILTIEAEATSGTREWIIFQKHDVTIIHVITTTKN